MKKLIKIVFAVLICLNVFTTKIQADTQPDSSKILVSFDANQKKVVIEIASGYAYADSLTQFELTVAGWDKPWQAAFNSGDVVRVDNSFTVNTTYAINKNGTYPITLKADGYEDYSTSLVVDSFVELDPAVTSISFNATNKTVDVVCSSSDYFNAISEVYVSNNWSVGFNETDFVTKDATSNSFSVLTTNAYGENGTYTFKIIAAGYKTYSQQYDVKCYESGGGGDAVPPAVTVTYSESTKLITVAADNSYIEKVNSISLENDVAGYWGCPFDDRDNITVYNGSFTIDATFPIWYNGTYKITVYADGYQNYVKNDLVITGFHEPPEIRSYPSDINASVNTDGDLIITSSDTVFIDDLVDDYSPGTDVLEGFSEETISLGDDFIYKYYFGIHNGPNTPGSPTRPLIKVNDNTVKFAAAQQLNKNSTDVYRGQVLNDVEYKLRFGLPGYTGNNSVSGKFTFSKSNKRIPVDHVKVYVTDGYVIISADNNGLDFLNKMYHGQIAILNEWGVITDCIELSEDDQVKAANYDTISDTYDRVYRVDTSDVTAPSNWTGLIDSTGYGQYCYDGRPFGGTTSISVKTFDVSKIGADGTTVTGTDKVIGIYRLPDVSPVNGKSVVGWQIKDKGAETIRCVGEEIFVTSDTKLYAIYENTPTPDLEKVDLEAIKVAIIVNTIKKINVATNAFGASLESDTFISENEKALGAAIWVETDLLTTDSEQHKQVERALKLDGSYHAGDFVLTFDINVFKQIGVNGDAIKISETDTAIEIALDLSSSEDAQKLAAAGKLGLYSIHDGKPQEVIRGIYNLQTKIYTVTISKFSTFAFVQTAVDPSTVIDPSVHFHDLVQFEEWTSTDSLPTAAGNYYLANDVTIPSTSSTWTVPDGEINLCLNGHGIIYEKTSGSVINVGSNSKLNIYDCDTTTSHSYTFDKKTKLATVGSGDQSFTGGYITGGKGSEVYDGHLGGGAIVNEGTLNIYGGTIIGNIAEKGGGIFNGGALTLAGGKIMYNAGLKITTSNKIENGDGGGVFNYQGTSAFTMTGGEISNNKSVYGGGVHNRSTFTMTGGTIAHNSTAETEVGTHYDGRGSGVYLYSEGSISNAFYISGNPAVYGNNDDNVYIDEGSIITANETLTSTTPIGVTMENPGVFTSGLSGKGNASNFRSDDSDYAVTLNDDDEAQLAGATVYDLWVGGKRVTSGNMDNILNADAATASYDPDTNTLTLSGATISDGYDPNSYGKSGIYYSGSAKLNIVLSSGTENTIASGENITIGINSINGDADIAVSGDGKLTVSAAYHAIAVQDELEIKGGTIIASGGYYGMNIQGNVAISGGTVTASGTGNSGIGISAPNITFSGGSVTAFSEGYDGKGILTGSIIVAEGLTVMAGDDEDSAALIDEIEGWNHNEKWIQIKGTVIYPLWVGSVQVTGENKDNILGDTGTATASYDSDTKTLTLNNATITDSSAHSLRTASIYSSGIDLTINIIGTNIVGSSTVSDAVYTDEDNDNGGKLEIKGTGTLNASAEERAIYASTDLVISGGTVTAITNDESNGIAIQANGNLSISRGTVTATSSPEAILASNGSVTISGGTVNATANGANKNAIYGLKEVNISGGTVNATAKGTNGVAINGTGDQSQTGVTISGGNVTAVSEKDDAISSLAGINISDGTVAATGKINGVFASVSISIGKNANLTAIGETCALSGSVANGVAGTGWTNTAGTAGMQAIDTGVSTLEYLKVQFPAYVHEHSFTYSVSGAVITATCANDNCDLTNNQATLTIDAPLHTTYGDGKDAAAQIIDANGIRGQAATSYYKANQDETRGDALAGAPTEPGKYWAEITLGSGENAATAHVVYTIDKANPTVTVPSGTAKYGQTLNDVMLTVQFDTPGTWSWVDPITTSVGAVGEQTFKMNFTPDDEYHYNSLNNTDVTVTVGKADNPATVSDTATVKKGGNTVDLEDNITLNGASGTVNYAISGEAGDCDLQGSIFTSGNSTGTVTVNVTVAADDNYNALAATPIIVTITEKDTQTIAAENVTVTYGDTGKAVSAKVSDPETGGGKISYGVKTGSEEYIEVDDESGALTIKKAGTAIVTVTAAETDDYAQATKDITVTINKADPVATAPSASATYGQTLSEVTLTNPDGNTEGSWSWADSSASVGNVGSRTFKANFTPTDSTNYNSVSNVDVTVTVAEADPSYTAPSAKTGLVYNKSAQQLITEGSTEDGTMYYCIGEDATTPTAFGTDIPTATNAGTYYVFYHVKGDDNHKDTGSLGPVEVTIAQADPAKLLPYGFAVEAEPGDSLSSIELPEGWVWSDTAEYVGDEGTHTFKAKYTGDTVNYSQDPVDITVNVAKAFYDYVSGSSSGTWTKGSSGLLSFTFKRSQKDKYRTFNSFVSASYDGDKTMTEDTDFTIKAGSLILTINDSLLNSLNVGTHTLTVRFEDGTATTTFRVIEKSSGGGSSSDDYQPPRTGIE